MNITRIECYEPGNSIIFKNLDGEAFSSAEHLSPIHQDEFRERILRPLEENFIRDFPDLSADRIIPYIEELAEGITHNLSESEIDALIKIINDELFRALKFLLLPAISKIKDQILISGKELIRITEDEAYHFTKSKYPLLFKNGFPSLFNETDEFTDYLKKAFIRIVSHLSRDELILILAKPPFVLDADEKEIIFNHFSHRIFKGKTLKISKIDQLLPFNMIFSLADFNGALGKYEPAKCRQRYLEYASPNARSVKSIHFGECRFVTYKQLKPIKNFHALKYLDLTNCFSRWHHLTNITDRISPSLSSLKFLKELTHLKHLNLTNCGFIKNTSLDTISKLTELEFLSLRRCYKISSKHLFKLKKLKKLNDLNIRSIKIIEYSFLKKIPSLKTVHITFNSKRLKNFKNFKHCDSINIYTRVDISNVLQHLKNMNMNSRISLNGNPIELSDHDSESTETKATNSSNIKDETLLQNNVPKKRRIIRFEKRGAVNPNRYSYLPNEEDLSINLFEKEITKLYTHLERIDFKKTPKHTVELISIVKRLDFLHILKYQCSARLEDRNNRE